MNHSQVSKGTPCKVILLLFCFLFLFSCKNEIVLHTVNFESGNDILQTIQINEGNSLGLSYSAAPEEPEGKEFLFWSIDGETPYDFSTPVDSDFTLHAVWKTVECKVSFINNYTIEYISIDYGSVLTEDDYKAPPTEDAAKEFLFWSEDGKTPYDFNKAITSDLTLYAIWTDIVYTVKFMDDNNIVFSAEVKKNTLIQEIPAPDSQNKKFRFWSIDGVNPYDFNSPINKDITFYAIWDITQYRVTFMKNAFTEIASIFVKAGDTIHEPSFTAPEGKRLAYWSTTSDGNIKYDLSTPIASDLTLYAVWEDIQYTITFMYNDSVVSKIPVIYGHQLEPITPPETDFAFLFWSEDGTTEFDFSTPVYSNKTLYAIYNMETVHAVIFMNENAVYKIDTDVPHGTPVKEIAPPETPKGKSGFMFWSIAPEGAGRYNFDTPVQNDLTLYAIWMPEPIEFTINDDEIIINRTYGDFVNLEIPYGATSISDLAFAECSELEYISIPESVTYIGECAFQNCKSLKEIIIPNGITEIKYRTFDSCTSLQHIEMPSSLQVVGDYAFEDCSMLKETGLFNGITDIGDYAYSGCSSLTSAIIPDSVKKTKLGTHVFENCTGIITASISKQLTELPDSTFENCTSLERVEVPISIRSIGQYSFSGCSSLKGIKLPSEVLYISSNAFSGCKNLSSINIPDNIIEIGDNAFRGCSKITSIKIPYKVTSIKDYTFYACSSLEDIQIPDSVTYIGEYAFYGCSSLTDIQVPDSVAAIGDYAFSNCSSLGDVHIPDNVSTLGLNIFNNSSLNSLMIKSDHLSEEAMHGYATTLGTCSIVTLIVSDFSSVIPYYAFSACSIMNIQIPDSVTSIRDYAFSDCSSLGDIYIPDHISYIGKNVFDNSSLKSLTINAESLSSNSLDNCSITTLILSDSSISIPYSAFSDCSIMNIQIPDSVTSIGDSAFSDCIGLTNIQIPDSVTSIGANAFRNCSDLTGITIPDGVTSFEAYLFYRCSSLTDITIPDSLTSIGNYAFSGCTNLKHIQIPASVNSIGNSAFSGCSNLTDITIPKGVTSINDSTFHSCTSLTNIQLSNSITSIGDSAFYGCSNLKEIIIPNSVSTIEMYAFSYCSSLTDVYCEASSKPYDWSSYWVYNSNPEIHWGYTGE